MSLVRKVSTLTFGRGLNILINFLFLPYMARMLSYDDYGTYGQVLLVVSFASAFLTFGLPQILYVYLSKEEADKKQTFSSNTLTLLIFGIIGAVVLVSFSGYISSWLENPRISFLLKIFSWSLVFQIPYESIVSWLIYNGKVKVVALLSVFSNLLKVLLVVVVVQLFESVELVFYSILITVIAQFVVAIYIVRSKLVFNIKVNTTVQQIKDGFPLGLTALFGTGILYIDGIMISNMLGVESYAIYRNGAIEVPFVSTIYASIAAIILPEVSKLFGKNRLNDIIVLKKRVIMNSIALIYPVLVFMLFYSNDFIVLYLGERYEASAIIFAIFNLTLLLRVNSYSDVLISANKGKLILIIYLIAFVVNIGLNYLLINELGRVGAAISTVGSIFLLAIVQLFFTVKLLNTSIFKLFSMYKIIEILLVSLVVVLLVDFIEVFDNLSIYNLLIKYGVYFVVMYSFILYRSHFEKQVLIRILPFKIFKVR